MTQKFKSLEVTMKSILQKTKECYVCHSKVGLHYHHIFFGKNREMSDKNGFTCYLCHNHHEGTFGVHGKYGKDLDTRLKVECQKKFEETHSREEFMLLTFKNYIM